MKKLLFFLLLTGAPLFAQNYYRIDESYPSISSTTATPYLVANVPPNSPILSVCSSPANQVPCTNTILTYDSAGNACPTGAQDTPNPQPSACQSTGDAQGNIGFWVPAGRYDYTVTIGTESFGPYTVTAGTAISTFGTGSFLTTTNLSSTTPGDCANWLAGNVLGDAGVCLTGNPAATTTITQPADGSGNPTSFNPNVIQNRVYSAAFDWHQFPTSPTALIAGVNNIVLAPCPLGLSSGTGQNHTLYIDTVGTAEPVTITTYTGTSGAASCTVLLTTANTHSAGYRIGSGTSGIREASVWAKQTLTNPTANPALGVVIVPPSGAVTINSTAFIQASNQTLDLSGTVLACNVAPCIQVGGLGFANRNLYAGIKIINPTCQPLADFTTTVGTTGATCIYVNAQHTKIERLTARNPPIIFPGAGYSAFYSLLEAGDDEGLEIDGVYIGAPSNFASSRFGRCDTTLCSVVLYFPSGGVGSSVVTVRNMNYTGASLSNGIDYQQANTIHILQSVIQDPAEFAVAVRGGNSNLEGSIDGWYGEDNGASNPNLTGTAGLIFQGQGWAKVSAVIPQGGLPSYARTNTGATRFSYFVQAVSSTLGSGPWLPAGLCNTNGTGTCTVKWPPIGTAGTITYNVARCSGGFGSASLCPTSLYTAIMVGGGVNAIGTVATGVTQAGSCTGTPRDGSCSITDDVTVATAAGTGSAFPTYCPAITFWPGAIVYGNLTDAACGNNPMRLLMDDATTATDQPIISGFGAGVPTLTLQHQPLLAGGGGGAGAPVWTQSLSVGTSKIGNSAGATILQNGALSGIQPDLTGRIGFINSSTNNSVRSCLYNLAFLDREEIINTGNYRISNAAGNNCLGISVGGTPINTIIGLQTGAGFDIYNGVLMDGTSWSERVTAALKSFKVSMQNFPTAAPTGASGYGNFWFDSTDNRYEMKNNSNTALKVGNMVQTANCGTTTTCSNVVLTNPQIIVGSVVLAGGTATITGITAFTSTTSYKCTATDVTAAAAVQCVHTSATSITLNGTGTDTIDYQIIGN